MFEAGKTAREHRVIAKDRESVQVTGVLEVLTFDEQSVVAKTELGVLNIKGRELRVLNLNTDTGALDVSGHMDALVYESGHGGRGKQSFIGRIFK